MKVGSIPQAEQEEFAHLALLSVQSLTHHHWIEYTIMYVTPDLVLTSTRT